MNSTGRRRCASGRNPCTLKHTPERTKTNKQTPRNGWENKQEQEIGRKPRPELASTLNGENMNESCALIWPDDLRSAGERVRLDMVVKP